MNIAAIVKIITFLFLVIAAFPLAAASVLSEDGVEIRFENNNRATEKSITTGISDKEYIEVVSGLEEGEKIVTRGYEWLRNRNKVRIMK